MLFFRSIIGMLALVLTITQAASQTLEERLSEEPLTTLAAAAREQGDAERGAVLFHQRAVGCSNCHAVDDAPADSAALGPNLTQLAGKPRAEDPQIIESILRPSASIRNGFETVTVLLVDGRVLTGIRADDSNGSDVVLRDASTGALRRFADEQIEQVVNKDVSIMPTGVVNTLASRQQFLDLAKYVFEIRDGGPARARELHPPAELIEFTLPEYESHVDHAGLIEALDDEAFARGEAIYDRLCVNCHGTHEEPGSLPTALRFAEGTFRNGSDPFAMYRTLTHGFGQMVPQTWMVPQQKYDVIHYIREAYLKEGNASQYKPLSEDYLAALPQGDTFGPPPVESSPWSDMDYGPWMFGTFEFGKTGENIAYKGLAVRLDPGPGGIARGNEWMVFDHDTMRIAGAWHHVNDEGMRFINWRGIHFDGRHQTHPRVVGEVAFANPSGPGWANPETGAFVDDQRVEGRDGRRYGPLPKSWATYRGMHHAGNQQIVSYTIGDMSVLERFGSVAVKADAQSEPPAFARWMELGPTTHDQTLLICTAPNSGAAMELVADATASFHSSLGGDSSAKENQTDWGVLAGVVDPSSTCTFEQRERRLCLHIPASQNSRRLALWVTAATPEAKEAIDKTHAATGEPLRQMSLADEIKRAATPLWPEVLQTQLRHGKTNESGFAADVLSLPKKNPWLARIRLGGLDFYPDGNRMVVCCWDGDVFEINGIAEGEPGAQLFWRRIASGLFQPLGILVIDGDLFVTCRDQLVVLRDQNGDGATDFYECFNNDHQVTEHFHEFAMGLQRDVEGNFYYAKSARHALKAVVPHHGTLLRISPDGEKTEILATGFRAANGVCLNADGSFVVTDQEGHWIPKNRINWVREGGFYGNMYGYHDVTDTSDQAMEQPLCWITNEFDRSPAELLWVTSPKWGNLEGVLLNMSYGYGKLYTVPHEHISAASGVQGAMCQLPITPFPTGLIRGRFHPVDGQLYACGLFAWASSQQAEEGGLYRIRYRGEGAAVPIATEAQGKSLAFTFSDPLSPESAGDPANYELLAWDLQRTKKYGSPHLNERELEIAEASLSADGRTVRLTVPDLEPTWSYSLRCRLETADGQSLERLIHGTIHTLE